MFAINQTIYSDKPKVIRRRKVAKTKKRYRKTEGLADQRDPGAAEDIRRENVSR